VRGLAKCAAFIVGVLAVSVVLTPALHGFLPFPFDKIFNRVRMVAVLVGIISLGGFRRDTLKRFGMQWTVESRRFLWTGFVTALPLLVLYTAGEMLAGHAQMQLRPLTPLGWAQKLVDALATGVAVGIAEEFLFRGFVFTSLRDTVFSGRVRPSVLVTSGVYALIHYLSIRNPPIGPDPGLADSLRLALTPPRFLGDWQTSWPSLVGLFLFGVVLTGCAARTRSLYPSIGLHIGSVFFLRSVKLFSRFQPSGSMVWGTYRVYDGMVGWVFLVMMGLLSLRVFPETTPGNSGPPVSASG